MKHRREIDGLRALAVGPVVVFHAGFAGLPGGFLGVDIFFVISGYLITSLVLEERSQGRFSLRTFYERRARRIMPALFFVTGLCFPVAYVLMYPAQFKLFGLSALSAVLFSSNYFFYKKIDYFDHDTQLYPLLHTWSLGVEEQFYLFLPLLMLLLYAGGARRIVSVVVTLLITSLLIAQVGGNFEASPPFVEAVWLWTNPPAWSFYLLPARAWELLLGSLAACILNFCPPDSQNTTVTRRDQILGALGLMLVCASFMLDIGGPLPRPLVPTCGTLLIILFTRPGTLAHTILSHRALVAVGLVSYSLYLWHQPLLALARIDRGRDLSPLENATIVALSGALAYVTWRFVERPFRDRTRVSAKATWTIAGLGSTLFLLAGGLAWALPASAIYGWRMQGLHEELYKTAAMRDESRACHTGGAHYRKPEDACVYFHKTARIAVFGDSHGVELSGAIADRLNPLGQGVMQFTYSGSVEMFGQNEADNPAAAWTHEAERYIAGNANLQTVVITYRMNYYLEHPPAGGRQEILNAYIGIVSYFVRAGKRVVVVLPPPELDANINDLILRDTSGDPIVSEKRARWTARLAELKSRLTPLSGKISIVDVADLFCDASVCHASNSAIAYYFDDNHPSAEGAKKVADAALRVLKTSNPAVSK